MLGKCYKHITTLGIASRSLQNAYRMLLRLASYWTMTPANLQPFPAPNSELRPPAVQQYSWYSSTAGTAVQLVQHTLVLDLCVRDVLDVYTASTAETLMYLMYIYTASTAKIVDVLDVYTAGTATVQQGTAQYSPLA